VFSGWSEGFLKEFSRITKYRSFIDERQKIVFDFPNNKAAQMFRNHQLKCRE
jgi:hypothetical protein